LALLDLKRRGELKVLGLTRRARIVLLVKAWFVQGQDPVLALRPHSHQALLDAWQPVSEQGEPSAPLLCLPFPLAEGHLPSSNNEEPRAITISSWSMNGGSSLKKCYQAV